MNEQLPRFMSPGAVAELFDINKATVYRMIDDGRLDAIEIGGRKRVLVLSVKKIIEVHLVSQT